MKYVAIFLGKLTLKVGQILKRGSSLPGKLALKIDKRLLYKLKYPKIKIIVTGSSGKGSTTKLIYNALVHNKKSVCCNIGGSNLDWGVMTGFLASCTFGGKIKDEYLVIEVDERFLCTVVWALNPTHMVITNLTKDQPPRNYHVDFVYQDILNNIPKNSTIITNMDDPYLRNFAKDLPNENVYFSLDKNRYSYKKQIFENLNIYYCPMCGWRLDYDYYNFETLGKYSCTNCDFKYVKPNVLGTKLNLDTKEIIINGLKTHINGDMLYDAYNTLAAFTTLKEIGIEEEPIVESLNETIETKTKETFMDGNKVYNLLNCKCENATTFNQALFKIINDDDLKDVIIGWREITKRYPHADVSWIYDITFEVLKSSNINNIYVIGKSKNDLKKRLVLANIEEEKIKLISSLEEVRDEIKNDKAKVVYAILNYDYGNPYPFKETFWEEEQ